jgi:hypothetical protein
VAIGAGLALGAAAAYGGYRYGYPSYYGYGYRREAFADLLGKHGRPVALKTALRQSVGDIDKRPPAPSVQRREARKAHNEAYRRRNSPSNVACIAPTSAEWSAGYVTRPWWCWRRSPKR